MSTTLHFEEHEKFHRAALYMALAAAGVALLGASVFSGIAIIVALAASAASLAAMATMQGMSKSQMITAFAVCGLGGTFLVVNRGSDSQVVPLLFAVLVALPMAAGLKGKQLLVSLGVGTVALWIARLAALSIFSSTELAELPHWAHAGLAGITVSSAAVFALLPRHLVFKHDSIGEIYSQLQGKIGGEMADLVTQGHSFWLKTKTELAEDDTNLSLLKEAILGLMNSAQTWSMVAENRQMSDSVSLAERMQVLEERIEKSTDKVVINQYQQAKTALSEQLSYIEGINTNRERVIARMHNYLAAMERLRLALLKLKSNVISDDRSEISNITRNLEEIGEDIHTYSTL